MIVFFILGIFLYSFILFYRLSIEVSVLILAAAALEDIAEAFIIAGVAADYLFLVRFIAVFTLFIEFNPSEIVAKDVLFNGLIKLFTLILLLATALFLLKLCLTMKSYICGCLFLGLKSLWWHWF